MTMLRNNLTAAQNRIAQVIVSLLSTFKIEPNDKLVAVLMAIVRHRDCTPEHCEHPESAAELAKFDHALADDLLMLFDLTQVPRSDDTFVALAWIADQIKHKTLNSVRPQIGYIAPGNDTVN